MSAISKLQRLVRPARHLGRDENGSGMVEFAFAFPILLSVLIGGTELSLVIFDYHRAGEATRRGARAAAIAAPMTDLGDLSGSVTCTSGTCTNGNAPDSTFDTVVAEMAAVLPGVTSANVEVIYSDSGVGSVDTPVGILPMVTVKLTGYTHSFLTVPSLAGLGDGIVLPDFATSYLAGGSTAGS